MARPTSKADRRKAQQHFFLNRFIAYEAKRAGVIMDTYDVDWILAKVMEWLKREESALLGDGIRKLKQRTEEPSK